MNTVLVRNSHSVRTKQYTKNLNGKYKVKAEISMKHYRSKTRRNVQHFPPASDRMTSISVYLWRHREHGDSNKRWHQRRFEPSQETGIKKMINGNVSLEFISLWFVSVQRAASFIQHCVSPLVLRLQKVQERYLCKTYSLTTSHPVFHDPERRWQFQFGNIRKITKISNSNRHFLENRWSYRCKILHDNFKDQAQWHISKLCSFL